MVDMDTILTPEEEKRLNESPEKHKKGKSVKLEDFLLFDKVIKDIENSRKRPKSGFISNESMRKEFG